MENKKVYLQVLHLELDDELSVLFEAMQYKDEEKIGKSKQRLKEISEEIEQIQG